MKWSKTATLAMPPTSICSSTSKTGIDTFDVIRYSVGEGVGKVDILEAAVGKIYTPRVTIPVMRPGTASTDQRYGSDDVTTAIPRHFADDPPGYSPVVWLYDVTVPQDPPYVHGSYKKLADIDPAKLTPRDTATTVWTKNMPVVGVASPCKDNAACGAFDMACNNLPDLTLATSDVPSGKSPAGRHDRT